MTTKKKKAASKAGRPKIEIDLTQVEALAGIGSTLDEVAAVLGVSPSTIDYRMANDEDFKAAYIKGKEHGKASLRRMQWNAAKGGSTTMMIWLGKQMLRQTDRREMNVKAEDHAIKLAEHLKDKDPKLYEAVVAALGEIED